MVAMSAVETRIDQIPAQATKAVRRGFSVVGRMELPAQKDLIVYMVQVFGARVRTLNLQEIADRFGIAQHDAGDAISALTAAVGILVDTNTTKSDFISASIGKIADAADEKVLNVIADYIISERQPLAESIDRVTLASRTLPSISRYEITVDLRPDFDEDTIKAAVPVAIMYIATDSNPEIWFQLRKDEVSQLIEALGKAEKQMASVEQMAIRLISKS